MAYLARSLVPGCLVLSGSDSRPASGNPAAPDAEDTSLIIAIGVAMGVLALLIAVGVYVFCFVPPCRARAAKVYERYVVFYVN